MASFTERYHTLTKYNPETIDKLGSVHWHQQPAPFKPPAAGDKINLKSFLEISGDEEGVEQPMGEHGHKGIDDGVPRKHREPQSLSDRAPVPCGQAQKRPR